MLRSPNRYLNELCISSERNFRGLKVQKDSFLDITLRFLFGIAGRGTAWQFRTNSRVAICLGIKLQNNPELHISSIGAGSSTRLSDITQPAV